MAILEKLLRSKVAIWILLVLPGLWPVWPIFLRPDPSVLADPLKFVLHHLGFTACVLLAIVLWREDTRRAAWQAQADADAVRNAGRVDATRIVQSASADAEYFLARLPEFKSNPQLFRDRRLTETMATVLANAQEKFFLVERTDGTPRELRVLLNREPMKPVAPKQP